ncbi:AAA family ATPase [Halomicroarcula sp. F13]|uniref:non-specific serine/threonine protein kinase n=1 Tax=Haloarcula rubra TaxID=2487747 RepID=A0AAW4PS49_9EURY|nr:ATPase domain-containing protein [Halomicroarcula rubra]MBX0324428.1 AAA family ATPase [Halomicroarcula rubra]
MAEDDERRCTTGIDGLDTVLHGGLVPGRTYMVTGRPGTGKTILGQHFLTSGPSESSSLFVNLEESESDVRANAETLGFDLEGVEFLDMSPGSEAFTDGQQYEIFAPSEVEGPDVVSAIDERVRELDPDRVFIDPLTQLRNLSPDTYQFRKQINGLIQFFRQRGATVLFTSQATPESPDDDLQYVSDGTFELTRTENGRAISVPKFRGSGTEDGHHSVRITDEGIQVYPVLHPEVHSQDFTSEVVSSGVPEVDQLLNGGVERGTVTVLSGPTGVGKTTLGTQFMKEAAGRGERSAIYMFEENRATLLARCESVNVPAKTMVERGTLTIKDVTPLDKSPAEFAAMVREEVEQRDARIVMIDGIDGYRLSLQGDEADLERELNSLGRYLKNMGVTVILVDCVDNVTGQFQPTKSKVSYLADNIVFLRYLEMNGRLRKAIGILKKRTSDFERTLREFEITQHGITVGKPLTGLRGVLSGTPEFTDEGSADGR